MKYALKKIRMMRVYDMNSGVHKVTLNDLKTAQFTGSQETIYVEGTDGAKLVGFDINKVAGFNATNATVDDGYLAMQVGAEPVKVTNGNAIQIRKVLTTADGQTISLPFSASGDAGNEIGYIYAKAADGMPGKAYAQAAEASATEFAYADKVITLPTGVFKANDQIIVDFFPTFKEYTMIENDADKFAMTGRIVIDAWFTDICTQLDVPMQVVMARGKISGEIDMSFGDAVAVQSVAVEAMSNACDEDANLWRMYTYDEEEIVA